MQRASATSRKSMYSHGPSSASKACRLDIERGKPSMRKGPSDCDIALRSRPTVVSETTILPSSMILAIFLPSAEPDLTSARSKSPADRWTMP